MRDPGEGRGPDGMITTGVGRGRIDPVYEPVLAVAAERVRALDPSASLAVYGSVATGRARWPSSDVDLLTVGLSPVAARAIGRDLSRRYSDLCRGVAVATYPREHLVEDTDAAYGDRVFLRHYCVPLVGVDHSAGWPPFAADVRAARGFNGDIAGCAERWRQAMDADEPRQLGRTLARKSLLAVAGLVSIHDRTWTTDRTTAAHRWGQLHPPQAQGLAELLSWSEGHVLPGRPDVQRALDGVVQHVVSRFADQIGVWT